MAISKFVTLPSTSIKQPDSVHRFEAADLIVAYLESLGVDYVFGIPGGAIEPLYNALARSMRRGGPRPVVVRHESGAAFMADGYSRETGKLGVCCATSGPGATNLITGVSCAYDNGVPLLVITGQSPLPTFGKRAFQESSCTGINIVGMFQHCTRYNSLVSHSDQLENKLITALMSTHQLPNGPAHLSIPVDIMRSLINSATPACDIATLLQKPSLVDMAAVKALHSELEKADKIVLVIGGGCGEAIESILEFAELTDSLFVTTPDGKGLVSPKHRLYRGVFGFAGHNSANSVLLDEGHLTLAIGTSFGEWASGAWSKVLLNNRMIHIDASSEHFFYSPMSRLHVRGQIRTVFEYLLERLRSNTTRAPRRDSIDIKSRSEDMLCESEKYLSNATPIKPQRLMRELSQRCPPNTRFLAEPGNSMAWAVKYLQINQHRVTGRHDHLRYNEDHFGDRRGAHIGWLRVVTDFSPMGWAIGAAIGVARGSPDCPVVCITGDGSYLMNGQEITVAEEEKLTVIFVILNDGALGMVKHGQRLAGAEPIAFGLPQVDYRLQAQSLGIPGHVIYSPEDMNNIDFDAILRRKGPTLLDVRIDGEEVPPMNVRMKVLGSEE